MNSDAPRLDVYDPLTIVFHWLTALIVLALFGLALFPGLVKGSMALHKTIGITLLVIVPLRLVWGLVWRRLLGRRTQNSATMSKFLRLGATSGHVALYVLLLTIPLLGWLYQDAKALPVDPFGLELPMLLYYDYGLATKIFWVKKLLAYALLGLIFVHAAAAILYHHLIRRDGVLASMVPGLKSLAGAVVVLAATAPGAAAQSPFDFNKFAADVAASLVKACPMAAVGDRVAHEACRENIGKGPEAAFRGYSFLFGGQQPAKYWLHDKKTSVFRGDLFQDLYMSLYMYNGKFKVEPAADGLTVVRFEAYFRNALPPGQYPYPFWHSAAKWDAYEKSNEIRLRMSKDGRVLFAYRADVGSEENRGPYTHVERPAFLGEWMWRDDSGGAQPAVTLFSGFYSKDNPNLQAVDAAYRKMATSMRAADCTVCHQPEGHSRMNRLVLLQTPLHAAIAIDTILNEVRTGKMPVDDYDDPRALPPAVKQALLDSGEAFKKNLETADAWERDNGRPKARR